MKNIFRSFWYYSEYKKEDKITKNILLVASFDKVKNKKIENIQSILFVIPTMTRGGGGLTSVLRIAKVCDENGIKPFYYDYEQGKPDKETQESTINLKGFVGAFLSKEEVSSQPFSIICATNWQSVFYAKLISGYHVYFCQDFEPYFYPIGSNYLLALKTYNLGFHIISLGGWNAKQIKQNIQTSSIIDEIDFPFEPKEYQNSNRNYLDYLGKKEFTIAVYIKRCDKRAPSAVQSILENVAKSFKNRGITLKILYYGLNKFERPACGKNLGRLNKNELLDLYKQSDFGLVASLTNVSLVPLEMLATGLPVIDFADGSYPFFLGDDTAILIDFDYHTLERKLFEAINNPLLIEKMMKKASQKIKNLSWNTTGEQFVSILKRIEN